MTLKKKTLFSLYLLYRSRQQWISSKQTIYVINLEASNKLDTLLIQDAQCKHIFIYNQCPYCFGKTTTVTAP